MKFLLGQRLLITTFFVQLELFCIQGIKHLFKGVSKVIALAHLLHSLMVSQLKCILKRN